MAKRRVDASEAERHLGDLLDDVDGRGDEVVIERGGREIAVLIPAARFTPSEEEQDPLLRLMAEVHERTRHIPLEVVEEIVEEAIRETRSQHRASTTQ